MNGSDVYSPSASVPDFNPELAASLYHDSVNRVRRRTNRLFARLMVVQWCFSIVLALAVSPTTWHATDWSIHPHVWTAIFVGGLLTIPALILERSFTTLTITPHAMAAAQALYSSLLIDITGGRIETHFHVFGSLAFLAFYRDWRILTTASSVVVADHFLRGLVWPESIYGISQLSIARTAEHASWIAFEDVFLIIGCCRKQAELWDNARREAQLVMARENVEHQVDIRTRALHEETAKLQLLIEGTDAVFWEFDPAKNQFVFVSPQAERFGYPLEDWYRPDFWAATLNPEYREQPKVHHRGQTEQRHDRRFRYRMLSPSGRTVWVDDLVSYSESDDKRLLLRGVMIDVTEQVETSQSLKLSEQKARAVFNQAFQLIGVLDPRGRILEFNLAAQEFSGLTEASVQGLEFSRLPLWSQASDRDKIQKAIVEASAGCCVRLETHCSTHDGRTHIFDSTLKPILDDDGQVLWLVYEAHNITAIRHSQEALRIAKEQAEVANQSKSEFLANMSHEIRTPMTAILGYADLLMEEEGNPKVDRLKTAQTIKRNGEHLLSIINDILDLSKIEAGKLQIEKSPCAIPAIVEDVVSLMRVRATEKTLKLEVRYETPIPEQISSDELRVRQILTNLVGNAIKFTETGSVQLFLRFVPARSTIEVDVLDSGLGMSEEAASRLFQPFSQADASTTRKFGGTGLGLTISRRLASLLGASVFLVESQPNVGTRFRLCLPVDVRPTTTFVTSHSLLVANRAETRQSDALNLEGARVLLAEDGPDNQRLIRFVLQKAGAVPTVVENGQLAVDAVVESMQNNTPYDVVLMDMQMPILDGYQATRRLRLAGYSGPVIALTANAMSGDRETCLEAGCDDYAAKPIDRKHFLETIARSCRRKSAVLQTSN